MTTRENKLHILNTAQMRSTRNGLDAGTRQGSLEVLNRVVVDLIDATLAARQAHWNVRGNNFSSLHELFEKVAVELSEPTDRLAERAAALGGIVRGTAQAVASETRLKPYPALSVSGDEHIEAISARLASLGSSIRESIQEREQSGDPVTLDHLIEAGAVVDKLLWLVESHIAKLQ